MAVIQLGPCDWPLEFGPCAEADLAVFTSLGFSTGEKVKDMARQFLWNWTGKVFGPCPVEVVPCLSGCQPNGRSMWSVGSRTNFQASIWDFGLKGSCSTGCSCGSQLNMLRLPGPVNTVSLVLVDGELVSPSNYRIVNGSFLQLTDGTVWPRDGASDRIKITYTRGYTVPPGGEIAAGVLSLEMAKALCNDKKCQLPQRVQNITRQGVSMTMLDSFEGLNEGRTGIWLVDSWVQSLNRQKPKGQVFSVDVPSPGRLRVYR